MNVMYVCIQKNKKEKEKDKNKKNFTDDKFLPPF